MLGTKGLAVRRYGRFEASEARRGLTLVEFLVVLGIVVVLIALCLPAVRSGGREAARRAQCTNNLKQIGLALHNYHQAYGCFPPVATFDAEGRPLHSWRTLILPYMEAKPLYDQIDLTKPWDHPTNSTAFASTISVFRCPSSELPEHQTCYQAIVAPGAFWTLDRSRRLEEVTDGTSNTLMVVETPTGAAVPWMAPVDAGALLAAGIRTDAKTNHPGGVNVLLGDGSVRFLKSNTSADVLRALIGIADGRLLRSDEW